MTLLGLRSRVLMEMKTGYIIDLEVLDKRFTTVVSSVTKDIFNSPDVWD